MSGGSPAVTGRIEEVAGVGAGVEQGQEPRPTREEIQLVRTQRQATQLAAALVRDPFAPETADAVRAYLSGADAAVTAFAQVQCLSEPELRARIAELVAARRSKETSS